LWDDPDVVSFTHGRQLVYIRFRKCDAVTKFRVAFELVIEIDAKDKCVDFSRCKFVLDELYKGVNTGGFWRCNAETPDGEVLPPLPLRHGRL
jgi:hypothetical protein